MKKWMKELMLYQLPGINCTYMGSFLQTLDFSPLETTTVPWSKILFAFHKVIQLKFGLILFEAEVIFFSCFICIKKPMLNNVPRISVLVHENIFSCRENLFLEIHFWKWKNFLSKDWRAFYSSILKFLLLRKIIMCLEFSETIFNCFKHNFWDQNYHNLILITLIL